jgi:hypothetical protein
MKRVHDMLAGRLMWPAVTVAVVAAAAVLSILLLRDAVPPAEAKSAARAARTGTGEGSLGVRVRVEAVGTERDGITGRPRAGGALSQQIGETAARFVTAGTPDYPSECTLGVSLQPKADSIHLWKLETTAMDVDGGRSTLRVRWTRSRAGNPVAERDDTRTITLGPGDTHVIDFVEFPDPAAKCASVMVRIAADPIVPQGLRPVTVDLWTVDENAPGGASSVHHRVQGPGSTPLDYRLPPLDIQPWGPNTTGARGVRMDVSGAVQATITSDGFVDVVLTTVRRTVSGTGAIQGDGRVHFRTRVGETAAVTLPQPAGRLQLPEGGGSIDVGQLFAGHRLSLYVRVETARW